MEQDFTITYRIIFYGCSFREAVGLKSRKVALPVVSFIKMDVEDAIIKKYIRLSLAGIRFFCHFYYFKPVYHSIRKEEADDEGCTDT